MILFIWHSVDLFHFSFAVDNLRTLMRITFDILLFRTQHLDKPSIASTRSRAGPGHATALSGESMFLYRWLLCWRGPGLIFFNCKLLNLFLDRLTFLFPMIEEIIFIVILLALIFAHSTRQWRYKINVTIAVGSWWLTLEYLNVVLSALNRRVLWSMSFFEQMAVLILLLLA